MSEAEQLKELEAKFNDFVYIVSHDFKAPLRGIDNLCEWIEEDIEDENYEGVVDNLKLLRTRVNRLTKMVDTVTEISRVGRKYLEKGNYNVKEQVLRLIEGQSIKVTNISFDLEKEELFTYTVMLNKVLISLIENAILHNSEQIEIKVINKVEGEKLIWVIKDNGQGVEEKEFLNLTKIFHTLEPKETAKGIGGGLAFVDEVIKYLKGKLEFENNDGLAVRFEWPLKID